MNFLEALDGKDLLILFVCSTLAGFAFVYIDGNVLNKVETAIGIPAGTF